MAVDNLKAFTDTFNGQCAHRFFFTADAECACVETASGSLQLYEWFAPVEKTAEKVKTKRQMPPEYWEVIYGNYKESLRLCFLPIDDNTQNGYWFGFESEIQKAEPVFKAKGIMERYQNTQSPQINTDKSS
jgi:hypothetical protein